METRSSSSSSFLVLLSFLYYYLSKLPCIDSFYLPGTYPNLYPAGADLWLKVNSLTSLNTELPYGYYTLPFCRPPGGEVHAAESLGELLIGDRIENSPYRFRMNVDESDIFLCSTGDLSSAAAAAIRRRIDEQYNANLILDNLPVVHRNSHRSGYPVGVRANGEYYIFNHLKFKVYVHGPTIVGFEVTPCSFRHDISEISNMNMYEKLPSQVPCDPSSPSMKVEQDKPIVFSYEVVFETSEIRWTSRWDTYLEKTADSGSSRVHWFSILNSLSVVALLAGAVLMILFRKVRKDFATLEGDEVVDGEFDDDGVSGGWKLLSGDVFRPPEHAGMLCVVVGDGVQILTMMAATILLAAAGFVSPVSRGALMTGMLCTYVGLGLLGGYTSAKLWKTINGGRCKGWVLLSLQVAFFFTGIALLIFTLLNLLLWGSSSVGALSLSTYGLLLFLWTCVAAPLTILGSYFGVKSKPIEFPTKTNQIPREIPKIKHPLWIFTVGGGVLPFAAMYIELYFIMNSLWSGQNYYMFGFLVAVVLMLVVVCAEVSVVAVYVYLCAEDWRWWWKSVVTGGSVAAYMFMYAGAYYLFDLHSLSGPISTLLYVGYSLLMAVAAFLALGAVGFLSSFWFVHFLFSSIKLD